MLLFVLLCKDGLVNELFAYTQRDGNFPILIIAFPNFTKAPPKNETIKNVPDYVFLSAKTRLIF